MPDFAAFWGSRIKGLRLQHKMRQVDFCAAAAALGRPVSQQSLSGWETGQNIPREDVRPIIAKVLAVSVNDLFSYPEDDAPNGDDQAAA